MTHYNWEPTRVLLVCIAEAKFSRTASRYARPHALETNGMKLIERWERAELPLMFVERSLIREHEESYSTLSSESRFASENKPADFSNPRVRPRPGDLMFQSDLPSLLRNYRFNRLFEDLGGPLLILLGDDLGGTVLDTAIDGFLARHPIIIVTDAAPFALTNAKTTSALRTTALPLLSCFARLMKTDELLNEWSIS